MIFLDLPPWMLSLLLAPFGLVIGSFGNVLIHRLPQDDPADRDVVTKGSHCPSCKTPIKPWHNVPLFGWLWLWGKCAACGWRIPVRYPLVELLTGALFAASPWLFPVGTLVWAKGLICGFALVVLFFTDFTEMMLPDAIQFPLMVLGVVFTLPQLRWPETLVQVWTGPGTLFKAQVFHNGLQPAAGYHWFGLPVTWQDSLLGLAVGYGVPWAFERLYVAVRNRVTGWFGQRPIQAGMGMGDFKMLSWLGAFWGWAPMLGILGLGAALGVFLGIPLSGARMSTQMPRVRRTLRAWNKPTEGAYCWWIRAGIMTRMLPFGCFLALATPIVVFFGQALWLGYLEWIG